MRDLLSLKRVTILVMILIWTVWLLMVLNGLGHPILNGLVGVVSVAICVWALERKKA